MRRVKYLLFYEKRYYICYGKAIMIMEAFLDFNETELTIFYRQTGFTFSKFYRSADGSVYALDRQSARIFIGKDLLRSNVHELDTIVSATLEEGQGIDITFNDSSTVRYNASNDDAETIIAELHECIETEDRKELPEDELPEPQEETLQGLDNDDLNETYSKLANTGRSKAIAYLVTERGMNVNDACAYVDNLEKQEDLVKSVPDPFYYPDGTMTRTGILKVVKELKPGDSIHLEYEPLLGKARIFDTKFVKLSVDVGYSRYFSLYSSADDYASLMEGLSDGLFEYMHLFFFREDKGFEDDCRLERITILKKL